MTTQLLAPVPQALWDHGAYKANLLGTPIVLVADVVNAPAESRYSALRVPGAAAGYQVTTGKTLYITRLFYTTTAATVDWLTLSGTADAGDSQVAAPAGAAAEDARADGVGNALAALTARQVYDTHSLIRIATARYPCVRCLTASATLRVLAIAHEE